MEQRAVEGGGMVATGNATVGTMLAQFRAAKAVQPRLSGPARDSYRYHAQAVEATIGKVSLRLLDRSDIEAHVAARLGEGRSPATIRGEIATLRIALGFATAAGLRAGTTRGDRELCGSLELHDPAEKRWIHREEVPVLLAAVDAAPDTRLRVAVRLALLAGLRDREVLTRQWQDVDWEGRLLRVGPKAGSQVGGRAWRTKSRKTRFVPLDVDLVAALRDRWQAQGRPRQGWIVPRMDGEYRLGRGWLNRGVRAACAAAGIPAVTAHGLRHSFAALALESNVSLFDVSRILGHHSIEFTNQQYGHIAERQMTAASDRLREHLGPATKAPGATRHNEEA